nr:phage tail protein [Brucella anthropi]
MIKVLLYALYFFFITLLVPAHAGPVFAAVGFVVKAVTAFAASSWIGGVIVGIGKAVVVGLLNMALNKLTNKKQKQEAIGVVLQTQMGDDLPLSFVVGRRATAGKRKYWGTWGKEGNTPNAYFVDVIEVGSIPSYAGPQGINTLWIGDKKATIRWNEPHADGRGYPVEEFKKDGKDHCWVKFLDGTQTTADPYLVAKFMSVAERPFTASMIGRGKQILILTCRSNNDVWSGNPDILIEPSPVRCYDIRKDTTAGGSGPHRYGVHATYEPTRNNAVIIYNIVRGIHDAAGKWIYGGQDVAAYRLPASSWMAAANECDRSIDGRPQFECGAEIFVDEEPTAVIEQLRLGCNGRFVLSGGTVEFLVGAPAAPVFAFTDEQVLRSSDSEMDPWPSLSETHNTITATYPDPDSRWAMKDAPEYSVEQYVTDDKRWLTHAIAFRAVPDGKQVQALQKTLIEEGRRFVVHELTLPPVARLLKAGDVVSWTSLHNSYSNKLFIIERITRKRGSLQRVILRELEPTDYDPPEIIIPPTPGWIGPITVPTQPMYGWSIVPATINDDLGRPRRPTVRISCDPDQDDVTHVHVQLRLWGTDQIIYDSDSTPYAAPYSWILQATLPNKTKLEGRGKFVPGSNRTTDWSEWLFVETDDIRLGSSDVSVELEATRGALKEVLKDVTRVYDRMDEIMEQVAAAAAVGTGMNVVDRQVYTEEVRNAFAQIIEEKKLRADADSAIAEVTTLLQSKMDDPETGNQALASAVQNTRTEVTRQGGELVAMSESLTGVKAQVNDVSADGYLSIKANTNPGGGALSEVAISARAEKGGQTALGSLTVRVVERNGQLVAENILFADRTIFASVNGDVIGIPIVIENGQLVLDVGRIRKAIIDEFVTGNGKLQILGYGDNASIEIGF